MENLRLRTFTWGCSEGLTWGEQYPQPWPWMGSVPAGSADSSFPLSSSTTGYSHVLERGMVPVGLGACRASHPPLPGTCRMRNRRCGPGMSSCWDKPWHTDQQHSSQHCFSQAAPLSAQGRASPSRLGEGWGSLLRVRSPLLMQAYLLVSNTCQQRRFILGMDVCWVCF